MKRAIKLTTALCGVVLLPLGAVADEYEPTITDIVVESGGMFDDNEKDFDILLNAVLAAELEGALADRNADYTVFAPNDKAFVRLARNLGMEGWDEGEAFGVIVGALDSLSGGDPIGLLTSILLYHVSDGSMYEDDLAMSGSVDTLLGETILPWKKRLMDNEPDLKDPFFARGKTDIEAANGVIHTVTRVLIPIDINNTDDSMLPTITSIVLASGGVFDNDRSDFDILLNAVSITGLAGALDNPDDMLTVLAPNDKAFIRSARDLGYTGWSEEGAFNFIAAALTDLGGGDPIPLLTQVLLYHVIGAEMTVKQVLESDSVTTLSMDRTIHPESDSRRLGDNFDATPDPKISVNKKSNIRASNGFVHNISRVLMPVDLSAL